MWECTKDTAGRPTTNWNSTTNQSPVVKSSLHEQTVSKAIQVIGLFAGCLPVVTWFIIIIIIIIATS